MGVSPYSDETMDSCHTYVNQNPCYLLGYTAQFPDPRLLCSRFDEVQNGHNEVRRYLQSWKLSATECFIRKHVASKSPVTLVAVPEIPDPKMEDR